jgi:HK97 family phage prohead protease
MGFWRAVRARFSAPPQHTFDSPPKPISQLFSTLLASNSAWVGRAEALSVPAVQKGRNMLCSISTLPLVQIGPDGQQVDNPLLRQFDPDVPNVVTLAQTVEDLLFDSVAWWLVTAKDFNNFPTSIRRLDPGQVSVNPPNDGKNRNPLPSGIDPRHGTVYVDGVQTGWDRLIRFDSPNPSILVDGGRAIRRAILLDKAAQMYADNPRPLDYFTPAEGADEPDDDDVEPILAKWKWAIKHRATAWVPRSMEYHAVESPSPREMQLVELQRQVTLEIANALGIDPEDLGISTTSRTYFNAVDRKQSRINDVLAPYMKALTDRLSMGDVTRRGHRVQFDLTDYLKPDPAGRIAYYEGLMRLRAITPEYVQAAEGLPPTDAPEEPEPSTQDVEASGDVRGFAADRTLHFDLDTIDFAVDTEKRTVEGLVLPYNRYAKKFGQKYRFDRNSLRWTDPGRIKLIRDHDVTMPLGKAVSARETNRGVWAKYQVSNTPAGDEALMLAADGVLDGFSVGVDWEDGDVVPDPKDKNAVLVLRADWRETSLTAVPAFDDARVTKVAASRDGEVVMPDEDTTTETAPAVVPAAAQNVTLTTEQFAEFMAAHRPNSTDAPAEETAQVVNPTRPIVSTRVSDPPSYRFDRKGTLLPAAHDFGVDIIEAAKAGMAQNFDNPAYKRTMEFISAQFADDPIVNADVDDLNPTINVARYIDERDFQYPLWSRLGRGAPPNGINSFQWPKFSTSGITIQDYAENVEPETDDYQTTTQSVTPTAKAAKASMPRTVFDMGGTPGLGDLIWRKMTRAWYEAAEAVIVAALTAQAGAMTSLATLTPGAVSNPGLVLGQQLQAGLAALQFARGGFRFDFAAAQADLYAALASAVDTQSRPLYPVINPMNANGQVDSRFAGISIGGVPFLPEWALAAAGQTAATNSYLLDSTAADAWVSAPQRLDFAYEVNKVYIAAWGYMAAAVNDLPGTRKIVWDPVTP